MLLTSEGEVSPPHPCVCASPPGSRSGSLSISAWRRRCFMSRVHQRSVSQPGKLSGAIDPSCRLPNAHVCLSPSYIKSQTLRQDRWMKRNDNRASLRMLNISGVLDL
ncbi:hypothetical protein DPEC_G00101830 [Dallia pectoralis]|uniref:Uncharacterized protein n=1 Tax=Dallia pectoralis TaxID=75939 RepID=A0ACC2GXL2_DALPE|nr:hypothetical protein DPEC_G00101830 [Dallia pectoralis]